MLRNHAEAPAALRIMVDLCFDYDVHDPKLLSELLALLLRLKLTDDISSFLVRVEGVPALWSLENLPRAWEQLLRVDAPTGASEADTAAACTSALRSTLRCGPKRVSRAHSWQLAVPAAARLGSASKDIHATQAVRARRRVR